MVCLQFFYTLLFRQVVPRDRCELEIAKQREGIARLAECEHRKSLHTRRLRHKSVHSQADRKSDKAGLEIQFSSLYFCFRPQLNWIISGVHKPLACVCGSSLSYLTLLLLFAARSLGRTHRRYGANRAKQHLGRHLHASWLLAASTATAAAAGRLLGR